MAKQRGYEIVREYSDVISGSKAKRPGLDADGRCSATPVAISSQLASEPLCDSTQEPATVLGEMSSRCILRHREYFPTMAQERRRAPRYPLIASVEVIEPQTNTCLKARTSDLSLVGCYLDMTNSLPAGTEVRLRIAHDDATFTALGVVAHCQPNMGMGVRFTDVQLDQHEILGKWLAALVRD